MDSLDDILADYKSSQLQWILNVISFTILIYEYILTFQYEVERFWPSWLKNLFRSRDEPYTGYDDVTSYMSSTCSIRWSSFLFFCNRYIAIFGHFPVMVESFGGLVSGTRVKSKCHSLQMYHQLLAVILQMLIGLSLITRIYALYERNKKVLLCYIVFITISVGLFIWSSTVWKGIDDTSLQVHLPYGCSATLTAYRAHLLLVPWSGELLFDISVFVLTLWKTLTFTKVRRLQILTMVMRDGTMYFAAMATLIVGNIMTLLFGGPLSRGAATILVNTVSSTLVSRLLLNLRDPKWQNDVRYYDSSTINGMEVREQGSYSSTEVV